MLITIINLSVFGSVALESALAKSVDMDKLKESPFYGAVVERVKELTHIDL